jgi:hypothetical protein
MVSDVRCVATFESGLGGTNVPVEDTFTKVTMADTFSAQVTSFNQRPVRVQQVTVELPLANALAYTAMVKAGYRLEVVGTMGQMVHVSVTKTDAEMELDSEVTGMSVEAITEGIVRLLGRESWKKGAT